MPSSIITFLGAQGAAALTGLERVLSFVNTMLFGNLILVGLNRVRKRPEGQGAISGGTSTFSVRQPISPWQVVIGQRRVGGVITFISLSTSKQYLHMIVTLACHVSQEIGDIWLDDEVITAAQINASNIVSSGKFSQVVQTQRDDNFVLAGTSYTALHNVDVMQFVMQNTGDNSFPFQDVSPSAPGQGQFKRVGNVFTFNASDIGTTLDILYIENVANPVCRIEKSLGDEAGQPFPDLVAESEGKWTDAHRQTGHTKVYIRFDTSMLQGNAPNVSAVVKGLKLYDPRTGLTTWSANAALAVATYLMNTDFGPGAALSEIGSAELTAAANSCEERVALAAAATATFTADPATDAITLAAGSRRLDIGDGVQVASSGTLPAGLSPATTYYAFYGGGLLQLASSYANALAGTPVNITDAGTGTHTLTYFDEARYCANGAFLTSDTPVNILQALLGAMAGALTQVSDTWRVFSGAYEAATLTLSERDFSGAVQIEPMQPRDKWANGAKGVFTDPSSSWQPTDFPAIAPTSTYLAEDGGEAIYVDVDFSEFVTSSSQAQRLARILVRQARSGLTISAQFKLTAWRSFTGHSVAITFAKYGWVAKEFTIVDSGFAVIQGQEGPELGVQLTLRETNSTIFSWSAEDLAQSTPPHTNLPNPFAIAAPGAPAVVETLYQTTGSAGVKSRATVSWTAIVDPLVKSYEVAWQNVLDSSINIVPVPNGASLDIDDLEAGFYLFGVRAVNDIAKSPWSTYTLKELHGLNAPPSDIANFAVQSYSGQAKFTWQKLSANTDLDVTIGGRVFVRWSPKTAGASWNDGTLVNPDGYPGDTSIGFGPLTTGTYMAKAMDSSGNFSVNAAVFVITEAVLTALTTIATVTESPAFTGTKTNVANTGTAIQLDGTTLIDSMAALIDSWGAIDSLGGVQATGSYAFASKLDLGSVQAARLVATIDSTAFDVDDLIDSRLNNIDDWTSMDGGVVEDAEVQLMVRSTNDDPNAAPTWGPWHALGQVGDYNNRGFDFRLDFATANSTHNRAVSTLSVAAKH